MLTVTVITVELVRPGAFGCVLGATVMDVDNLGMIEGPPGRHNAIPGY